MGCPPTSQFSFFSPLGQQQAWVWDLCATAIIQRFSGAFPPSTSRSAAGIFQRHDHAVHVLPRLSVQPARRHWDTSSVTNTYFWVFAVGHWDALSLLFRCYAIMLVSAARAAGD